MTGWAGISPVRFVDRDMFMHFCGGGISHTSTQAETDVFKTNHKNLDIQSQQDQNDALDIEEEEEMGVKKMDRNELLSVEIEIISEGGNARDEAGEEVDQEGELLDWELMDYGYKPEIGSDENNKEEEDREAGEEDYTTIDKFKLGVLEYADY